MTHSIFLGQVFGWYLVIASLMMLLKHKQIKLIAEEFLSSRALILLSGLLILPFGLMAVITHNLWTNDWRVLITILSWLVLLKAIIRLFYMEKVAVWAKRAMPSWTFIAAVSFLLGIYLLIQTQSAIGLSLPL